MALARYAARLAATWRLRKRSGPVVCAGEKALQTKTGQDRLRSNGSSLKIASPWHYSQFVSAFEMHLAFNVDHNGQTTAGGEKRPCGVARSNGLFIKRKVA